MTSRISLRDWRAHVNRVTVGDFVLAYTLDWAKTAKVLNGLRRLEAYLEEMYARPRAPMRIAAAFASIRR
jgi:glutathione S-transferase